MGKDTGFKEHRREGAPKRPVSERVGDFREFVLPRSLPVIQAQGGRCMDCGVPFCHQGCPLGNPIPDFDDLVYRDRWHEAFLALDGTNNFPEFTGRLCPAPCEAACVLSINDDPVTIEQIELEIAERAFAEGWVTPRASRARSGHSVAVVGSGPAGLAAAQQLARAGHAVTVYERDDRLGGLLRYGIPDFKMEKHVIDRRLRQLEAEGVQFVTGADVGRAPRWDALRAEHDALLLAIGARRPRDLEVPGRVLEGVHLAMDYLEQQNRVVAGDTLDPAARIHAEGKHVIILGGGDTGSDCLGTALRQGARSVRQIELLPRPPESRDGGNPWPQWPNVFRVSSSQQEGGERGFALMTTALEGDGRVQRLRARQVDLVDGRLVMLEAPEVVYDCDLLLLAMGFVGPETDALTAQLGVELDGRGNVKVDRDLATSVPGVYAAGDAARGASLIVWAISEGREAARAIDAHLRSGRAALPTRGGDSAFGGR